MKNRNRKHSLQTSSREGAFIENRGDTKSYRKCLLEGVEVRVWGAEGARGICSEVVSSLRPIIKRAEPTLPLALMADYHPAELGVVGSVVASEKWVVPDLIGGDCGCGVYGARLRIGASELPSELLGQLFRAIREAVPLGAAQNRKIADSVEGLEFWDALRKLSFVSPAAIRKLRHQLGSLGGGNHFIEVAVDDEGMTWVLVHSGSRYLGGLLREAHVRQNIELSEAEPFLAAQALALRYAAASRSEIAGRVMDCAKQLLGPCETLEQIDLPHNFIALEELDGQRVAIHRKGACAATEGGAGIIPGSMGTGSYVVEGRGARESYSSSSHGAGRLLSRGVAFRTLRFSDVVRDMRGVIWLESEKLKDEAPGAYKDIDLVMRAQRDLVKTRLRLKPLISVKGEV